MITQKLVDNVVKEVLPTKYIPASSEFITSIRCVSSDKVRALRESYYPDIPMPKDFLGAITLNMEYIYYFSDVEDLSPYKGKFSIYLAQEIDNIQELQYVILNQIGQIDLQINFSHVEGVDNKLYADFFAIGGLMKVYDNTTAMAIAYKYGSI